MQEGQAPPAKDPLHHTAKLEIHLDVRLDRVGEEAERVGAVVEVGFRLPVGRLP